MSDLPHAGPASALFPDDPPKVGDFWLDARLTAGPSGVAYVGHDDNDNTPVMVIVLSDGAAHDAAARDRLAGEVNKLHIDTVIARGGRGQDEGRLAHTFRSEDDDPVDPGHAPLAPWVALAYDGSPRAVAEAERLLTAVDLSRTSLLGRPSGPDYDLHWRNNQQPGTSRLWPLPWPGRTDRAGWVTTLVAWLLMLLLAALALLIAVLIFSKQPPVSPPPPVPTTGSASGGGSASPSSSGSQSASPESPGSSGGHNSPTKSASYESPDPQGSKSGGSPTPNKKL
ncbi:hypothetical protein [Aestuariimicrobium kwangyangense]|uniref:hypothetical protein n=1 Tax=Aestuariimicrobium kwangyangense TaxID=396389 RepID=UPI00058D3B5A|nr:hypothetical protein [Aestuariimicrobium kwangyangense]